MIRQVAWGLLLVCVVPRPIALGDGCRPAFRRGVAVRLSSGFAVTPFAVPVAVPVATVTVPGLLYRYAGSKPLAPPATQQQSTEEIELLQPSEIIAQRCTACHRDGHADGGLVLDGAEVDELDRAVRVEIVRRITSQDDDLRMPRRGTLSSNDMETLLEALVK